VQQKASNPSGLLCFGVVAMLVGAVVIGRRGWGLQHFERFRGSQKRSLLLEIAAHQKQLPR
jgi:hypothetical protein